MPTVLFIIYRTSIIFMGPATTARWDYDLLFDYVSDQTPLIDLSCLKEYPGRKPPKLVGNDSSRFTSRFNRCANRGRIWQTPS
jgi:hypothetical protein